MLGDETYAVGVLQLARRHFLPSTAPFGKPFDPSTSSGGAKLRGCLRAWPRQAREPRYVSVHCVRFFRVQRGKTENAVLTELVLRKEHYRRVMVSDLAMAICVERNPKEDADVQQ